MEKILEVAHLRAFDLDGKDYKLDNSDNDLEYRRYVRCIRRFDRFLPYNYHTCWSCNQTITDWYIAYVYVARPAVFVHFLNRMATFWVEKHHYPDCPDRLREYEEEMHAYTAREDEARATNERKAA